MNLKIALFLAYNGDRTEIEAIIADISDVLMNYELGNSEDDQAPLNSLVMLQQITEENFDMDREMADSLLVIMPVQEAKVD